MRLTFRARSRRGGAVLVFAAGLLATGIPSAGAAGDADIRITGGNASAAAVCGNSAAARTYSDQRHIVLQLSRCTANADGGAANLSDVDIYVRGGAGVRNRGNVLLAALGLGTDRLSSAADSCASHRPASGSTGQLNECFAVAHGGNLRLNNVRSVVHHADGTATTRTIAAAVVPLRAPANGSGSASANCGNIVSNPVSQRDDCTGTGQGANWGMNGVDADVHGPTGTQTRHGINIVIKGGSATAYVACFNILDANNHVIQVNICHANAEAGDVSLHNVTIHTFS
jgi:hypothetical protein